MPYKCVARKDTKKYVNVAKSSHKFAKTNRFNDIHLVTLLCNHDNLQIANGAVTNHKLAIYEP